MKPVAEPLHDSLHFPLGVEILLAASTGLWQPQLRLGLLTRRFATAGVQRRGIPGGARPRSGTTVANRRTIASKLARIALRWAGCPKTSRNRDRFQCFGTWASVSTPSSRQSVGLRAVRPGRRHTRDVATRGSARRRPRGRRRDSHRVHVPAPAAALEQEGVGIASRQRRTVSKEAESSSIAQANRGCVTVTRIAARTPSAGSQYTSR